MILGEIEGRPITYTPDAKGDSRKGCVYFLGDMDIDRDGAKNDFTDANGKVWKDKYWQPETTLRYKGKSIDSETVPFIVVPPLVIKKTKGIIMGCQARIYNRRTKKWCDCVVGDQGPMRKTGEASCEAARRVGTNPNPVNGGEDSACIDYYIYPDVPATVVDKNGKTIIFDLQKS